MRGEQRKRQFIDTRVQGALVLQVFRQWALFFVGTFVLLLSIEYMFGERHWTLGDHLRELWERCGLVYLSVLVLLPAFLRDTVKLSHRFVGPVVRVRNELNRLAEGRHVEPIQLRKRDFWHDLAEAFNTALARLEQPAADTPPPEWRRTPPPPATPSPSPETARPAELVRS
jgi:hypothetical protein